jgi:hypothetical protein
VTKGCFRVPDGCEVSKCKYFVSWSAQTDKVDFELVAAMPADSKWAALGIGRTNMMVKYLFLGFQVLIFCQIS